MPYKCIHKRRACKRKSNKKYYQKNREKEIARTNAYREKNRDKLNAARRQRRKRKKFKEAIERWVQKNNLDNNSQV